MAIKQHISESQLRTWVREVLNEETAPTQGEPNEWQDDIAGEEEDDVGERDDWTYDNILDKIHFEQPDDYEAYEDYIKKNAREEPGEDLEDYEDYIKKDSQNSPDPKIPESRRRMSRKMMESLANRILAKIR